MVNAFWHLVSLWSAQFHQLVSNLGCRVNEGYFFKYCQNPHSLWIMCIPSITQIFLNSYVILPSPGAFKFIQIAMKGNQAIENFTVTNGLTGRWTVPSAL